MNPASILGDVIERILIRNAARLQIPVSETPTVSRQIANEALTDSVLKNQMNAEPLSQSRVVWGNVIAALGVLLPLILQMIGFDISEEEIAQVIAAITVLAGVAVSLYGRIKTGLKPLFSRS